MSGWAVNGTWSNGPWKVFAEASQRYGVLTPCDYISGGPSNRYTDAIAGITYTRGPVEYRCVYSYGKQIKGSGVFVLDRTGDKRWFSGHATTIGRCQRRIRVPRAEPRRGAGCGFFGKERDFEAFEEVIAEAKSRLPMRMLAS